MSSNTSIDTITVQSGTNSNSVRFGITIKNSAENIIINNCKIISIAWAIYTEWDGFGNFNHISITNCELIGSNPIYLQGCSDSLIENNFGIFSGGSYEGVCLAFIDSTEIFNNNIIRGNTFSLSRTDGEDTIAYPYIMRFYGHNNLIENNNISVVQPGNDYPYEARGFLEYGGLIDTPVSIITNTIRNNTFAITRKVVGYQYALCIILNQEGETTLAYADNLLKNNIFTYNCLDDPSQLLGSMYSYETSINHKVIIDTGGWQGSSRSIEHLTPKTTLEIL